MLHKALRTMTFWLLVVTCCAFSARAQKQPTPRIKWIKDLRALQGAMGNEDGKPVIFFINTKPGLLKKLTNLDDPTVVKLSEQYRCVYYEPNPRGDMAWEYMKRQGFGAYANKITFIDPTKVDRNAAPANFQDPQAMARWMKELKKATLWQVKPGTDARTLGRGMQAILKKLKRLPKGDKKDGKKKPAKKKGDEAPEEKQAKQADPAQRLFEKATAQEEGGKLYDAYKTYKLAARHDSEFGKKAAAAVRRLKSDPATAKKIAAEEQDKKAAAWLSLGKSFQKNEKWKTAAKYYERILKTYPKSKHAPEAKERLAQVKKEMEG